MFPFLPNSSQAYSPLTLSSFKLNSTDARAANHPYISYCVSKKEAEEAIWAFVESNKPAFTVTVLLPALIFGPPIQPVTGVKHMNYSTDVLYSLINGTYEKVPPTSFGSFVSL